MSQRSDEGADGRRNIIANGLTRFDSGVKKRKQRPWEQLNEYVICVLGENPSPYTLNGTNCYLIGNGSSRLLVDAAERHFGNRKFLRNLSDCMRATGCKTLEGIVITHLHHDHFGGVEKLQEIYGPIPVYEAPSPSFQRSVQLIHGLIERNQLRYFLRLKDVLGPFNPVPEKHDRNIDYLQRGEPRFDFKRDLLARKAEIDDRNEKQVNTNTEGGRRHRASTTRQDTVKHHGDDEKLSGSTSKFQRQSSSTDFDENRSDDVSSWPHKLPPGPAGDMSWLQEELGWDKANQRDLAFNFSFVWEAYVFMNALMRGTYPWIRISAGSRITLKDGSATLVALACQGHSSDHFGYLLEETGEVLCGDHVLGYGTTLVMDMKDYMESLFRLLSLRPRRLFPGHGPAISDGCGVLQRYISHRQARERQVWTALSAANRACGRPVSSLSLAKALYTNTNAARLNMANDNVVKLLRLFQRQGRIRVFRRVDVNDGQECATLVEVGDDELVPYTPIQHQEQLRWEVIHMDDSDGQENLMGRAML